MENISNNVASEIKMPPNLGVAEQIPPLEEHEGNFEGVEVTESQNSNIANTAEDALDHWKNLIPSRAHSNTVRIIQWDKAHSKPVSHETENSISLFSATSLEEKKTIQETYDALKKALSTDLASTLDPSIIDEVTKFICEGIDDSQPLTPEKLEIYLARSSKIKESITQLLHTNDDERKSLNLSPKDIARIAISKYASQELHESAAKFYKTFVNGVATMALNAVLGKTISLGVGELGANTIAHSHQIPTSSELCDPISDVIAETSVESYFEAVRKDPVSLFSSIKRNVLDELSSACNSISADQVKERVVNNMRYFYEGGLTQSYQDAAKAVNSLASPEALEVSKTIATNLVKTITVYALTGGAVSLSALEIAAELTNKTQELFNKAAIAQDKSLALDFSKTFSELLQQNDSGKRDAAIQRLTLAVLAEEDFSFLIPGAVSFKTFHEDWNLARRLDSYLDHLIEVHHSNEARINASVISISGPIGGKRTARVRL